MKIKRWIAVSSAFHLLVGAAYTLSLNVKSNEYQDLSLVQMNEPRPHNSLPMPEASDEGLKKKKPVIETNQKPELSEDDSAVGSNDCTNNYVPYYLVEELPVSLSPIQPAYPEEARRQGIEGKVMMMVYIDETGVVKNVEVQKTPSQLLADSAVKAVYDTKFRPARLNGQIKPVSMQLALKFRLE